MHRGSVDLIRTPDGVLVTCEAEILLEDTCSRCLSQFGYAAHISFDENYVQQVDVATGAIVQGRGAIGDTVFVAGGASTLINGGTISANISGQTLTVGTINVGSGLNTLTNQGDAS